MRWKQMTSEERDWLVAAQIMHGEQASYTTDLNAAWRVVERLAEHGLKTTGIHLFPHAHGCDAMIGPLYLTGGTVCAGTAPEAICLAALWVSRVFPEDVRLNQF
jgi:hypothetical protein